MHEKSADNPANKNAGVENTKRNHLEVSLQGNFREADQISIIHVIKGRITFMSFWGFQKLCCG